MLKLCKHQICKGGFAFSMKTKFTRCFIFFCCILLLTPLCAQRAYATEDIGVEGEKWHYSLIYSEEVPSTPNVVIIYLHGDNSTGTKVEHLERLNNIEHPVRYAREGRLELPDDTIMICPQANYDGQFRTEQEALEEFIHEFRDMYPDALIILSGASHGSLATYKIATTENPDVDAYVFIAGVKPGEAKELQHINNALVVFGDEPWLQKRYQYSVLFNDVDIRAEEYRKVSQYWEEETNNAYFRGPWHHGNTPLIFLEDFFWEWLNSISYN